MANRSATLYHLEKHTYALTDAEEALRMGYPRELRYKIEERRARCLLALKRHDEAVLAFRNALKALDDGKLSGEKKQKFEADIRIMLAVIEKGNQLARKGTKIPEKRNIDEPEKSTLKIEDCNPLYPSCSKAVEIRDEGGNIGRHAIATKDIEPGEILAIEKPYSAFLLAEYRFARIFIKIHIYIYIRIYIIRSNYVSDSSIVSIVSQRYSYRYQLFARRAVVSLIAVFHVETRMPRFMKTSARYYRLCGRRKLL